MGQAPGMNLFQLLCLLGLSIVSSIAGAADFAEQLSLRTLSNSALLASFNFASNITTEAFDKQDYGIFPRSLGQLLRHTHTEELHLRFSTGRWDTETWASRPHGGRREGGTGVELWAWISAATDAEADTRWLTLVNALSGLFCASLNFIDSTRTIRPQRTFMPEGTSPRHAHTHLLHGALPHEVVCTENLTPILKLLPCKGKVGISSLLDGHKLFDASWQTMAIDVRPVCTAGQIDCLLEIQITIDMVLDVDRSKRSANDPIPRPLPIEDVICDTSKPYNGVDTCYPMAAKNRPSWSLQQVFGKSLQGICLPGPEQADQDRPAELILHTLSDQSIAVNCSHAHKQMSNGQNTEHAFRLPREGNFDMSVGSSIDELRVGSSTQSSQFRAERTFTGPGQERGSVRTVLVNSSPSQQLEVIYLESLPWFMRIYLHTMQIHISDLNVGANATGYRVNAKDMIYKPAIDRKRGSHVELQLVIPPMSKLVLSYDFDKAILRYTEYPPDANRGFDVAPAVIRMLPSDDDKESKYVRTTSLLLPLPTPDFSMPYNVIILTSTVIAMGFGSVFNILTRRFVAADEAGLSTVQGLKYKVRARLALVRHRLRVLKPPNDKKTQ